MAFRHPAHPHGRFAAIAVAVLLGLVLHAIQPGAARADVILSIVVEDSTASAGSTGNFFDVILTNASTSGESVFITGFSLDLLRPNSASYVTFTNIGINTALPYVFSVTGSFPGGPTTSVAAGEVTLNDSANTLDGQALAAGASLGLARVEYSVAAGAPGGLVPVTVASLGAGTTITLGSPDFPVVTPNATDGTITIQGEVIPEPASLTMLAIAGFTCLAFSRLSRLAARRSTRI